MKALHLLKTSKGALWALRQIEVLKTLGIDVEVVLPDIGPVTQRYEELGVRVHIAQIDIAHLRSPLAFAKARRRLLAICGDARPDVLHSHFVGTTLFARLALRGIPELPLVFQVAGPLHLENPITRRVELSLARRSDYWLASCKATQAIYLRSGVSPHRLGLSYYWSDFAHFQPTQSAAPIERLTRRGAQKMVGMVAYFYAPKRWLGQTRGIKGHEDLIDAVRLMVNAGHDIVCAFAGGAWERAEGYRARVESYGRERLGARAVFLGHCDDVRAVYEALDVAVHPSLSENLGGAVESLALGVPTVATNVGGLPDAVIDGETGWLAEPRNPASLAAKIGAVLANPEEAKRRARLGQDHIRSLVDPERNTNQVIEMYRRMVGDQRG